MLPPLPPPHTHNPPHALTNTHRTSAWLCAASRRPTRRSTAAPPLAPFPLPNQNTQDERVAVCSIEKANVAINKMLAEGRLGELEAVVVDEVHMVADPQRWAQSLPLSV